ncbi:DUF222 domain-containing protein [Plantibacter sp. M259]|uniref:DUF222 domain-containing protein n=1 Tax=Plantibacter sp. M259 TaxID=2583822 RepID=UPI0011106E7D|nr:DUF222 domain-containing protein [Plantibacter sp. M259]
MTTSASREHPSDVFAVRLASFSDRFAELARRRAALDAEEARLLAEAAAYADATTSAVMSSRMSESEGRDLARRSICASLAMATRMSEPTLQHRIGEAEALVHQAPSVLEALERGTISAGHARAVTDQLRDVPAGVRERFLQQVLPVAERTTPALLKRRARVLRERLHPESITVRARRSRADRRVTIEPAADGMAWLNLMTTAPIAYAIMSRLDGVAVPARAAGDDRTLAQLRADALASLAVAGTVSTDGKPIPADPESGGEVVWLGVRVPRATGPPGRLSSPRSSSAPSTSRRTSALPSSSAYPSSRYSASPMNRAPSTATGRSTPKPPPGSRSQPRP